MPSEEFGIILQAIFLIIPMLPGLEKHKIVFWFKCVSVFVVSN